MSFSFPTGRHSPFEGVYSNAHCQAIVENPQEDISKARELVLWIKQVHFHALSGGFEDQLNLQALGQNIPISDITSPEIEAVFEAVEEIASEKIVNLGLPSLANAALVSLNHRYPNIVVVETSKQSSPHNSPGLIYRPSSSSFPSSQFNSHNNYS